MSQTESPLIAIVDDDASVCDSISSLIRSAGYRSEVFTSAEAFLVSDDIRDTDCLVLDVRLPGLSGLDLQRRLSGLKLSIPIIFITAHADDRVLAKALEQGALAFLSKPFSGEALLAVIQSALNSTCQ